MKIQNRLAVLGFIGLAALPMFAAGVTDTDDTILSVTVAPEASLSVQSSPTLTKGGTEFESYTGQTTFSYRVRTEQAEGTGSVTALVTSEFDEDSNITTADLSHVAATSGVGTANAVSTPASASSATNILSFGSDAHSADGGDSATITWTLADRPEYKTGSYSATVTLTISAL